MLFSLNLLRKIIPELSQSSKKIAEDLSLKSFETEAPTKKILEISLPPNRYSDVASHWGLASEISAIYDLNYKKPALGEIKEDLNKTIKLEVGEPELIKRMAVKYFEDIKIGASPKWMQDILHDCGFRSINNLVDITNYVTLETGQPLHAFDLDKMEGDILKVRHAKKGEMLETLDEKKFNLDEEVLVLADAKNALDLAGIKGGKKAEIGESTKKIILTAGNFNGVHIYKTVRKLNFGTDASSRFSHHLSPYLVEIGINRATELIKEFCSGVSGKTSEFYPHKASRKLLKLDIKKFNQFSGLNLNYEEAFFYLSRLGFKKEDDLIEIPWLRMDIEYPEDLMEEIIRFYGYEKIPSKPVVFPLLHQREEDRIILKDKVRDILVSLGFNEVYNFSFVSKDNYLCGNPISLENPISSQFEYMRTTLATHLFNNIQENIKYTENVRLFEIGKIFNENNSPAGGKIEEQLTLGVVLATKEKNNFLEMKGVVYELLNKIGLIDFFTGDLNMAIQFLSNVVSQRIEGDHGVLGYFGLVNSKLLDHKNTIYLEINLEKLLKLARGEKEYEPLSRFPSVMRDISLLVNQSTRVEEILNIIQESGGNLINDVDLLDFYEDEKLGDNKRSLTFRIVFQSHERTLIDEEINELMEKIIKALKNKFEVDIR